MRPTLILPPLLILCAFAGAAAAQQATAGQASGQRSGETAGLRYLSWPGKAAATPVRAVETAAVPAPAPASNPVPLARIAPAPTSSPVSPTPRPGLTPASAWAPPKVEAAPVVPVAPAPMPSSPPTIQPQPASAPPPPEAQPAADPMAPRADAPIFRLQRPAATDAAPGQAQTQMPADPSSARYYSLHRQAGHAPDAIATPQAVYLDALPVELAQTPQSADLAEPPAPPALMRGADGRLTAAPQIEGDSLP